jgi:hypothetical protein
MATMIWTPTAACNGLRDNSSPRKKTSATRAVCGQVMADPATLMKSRRFVA